MSTEGDGLTPNPAAGNDADFAVDGEVDFRPDAGSRKTFDPEDLDPHAKGTAGQSRAWMITFTDLVSLMLTFFVLLFSMSHLKIDQWETMIDSLSQTLNPTDVDERKPLSTELNIGSIFRKSAINLDYLVSVLGEAMDEDPLLRESLLLRMDDRLLIALPGDLLFQPGQAILNERARQAIFNLGGVLRNIGNQIGVNGHTDPIPPGAGPFASNWELSVSRAAAVANALRTSGYGEEITAFGYAASRFDLLPDLPPVERRAMARRVDVVVFPDVGDL
ncbi:MAG: flagellar motor protein MotB [Magnetovibrionaceae bacterium]